MKTETPDFDTWMQAELPNHADCARLDQFSFDCLDRGDSLPCERCKEWEAASTKYYTLYPDFSECKNDSRADMAQKALAPFVKDDKHAETEQHIRDLITNLHHLCDRKGLIFSELYERAERMYQEEINTGADRDADCGPKCELDDEGQRNKAEREVTL